MRGPAEALASSVFQFHSSRTRSPSKPAVPSPAETDTGSDGPGSRYSVTGSGETPSSRSALRTSSETYSATPYRSGLHGQLIRVVRLGEPAGGGLQQRIGAVAQPQPEPPRLPALLERDPGQRPERHDEFAQLAAEEAHVLVPARGDPQGVAVERPGPVLLDDFRHAGILPPDLRDSGLDQGGRQLVRRSTPPKGAHVRRHHSTTPRTPRVLGCLLLLAAAGGLSLGPAPTAQAAAPTPLHRVVPAPASVTPGGTPYRITRTTRVRADGPRRGPPDRHLPGRPAASGHRLPAAGHRPRHRRHPAPPGERRLRRRGVPADERRRRSDPHRTHPRRALPRRPDAASAPPGVRRAEDRPARALADRRRHRPGPPPLRLPGRHAGRLPALLHGRPGQALHRPGGALQGQRAASAHQRRPGAGASPSTPWPRLASYGGSTQVGGGRGGFYTKADYREIVRYAASRYLEVVPEIDMPGHTNAAPRLVRPAQLRRRGTPAVHRHPGRLQLAVRAQGGHLRLRGRRDPGAGRPHPRPLPAHRRRRGALHQPHRLRPVHGPGAAGRRPVRQDGHRLAPAHRRAPRPGRPRPVLGPGRHRRGGEGAGRAGRPERHGPDPVPGRPDLPGHEVHERHPAGHEVGGPGGGETLLRLEPRRVPARRTGWGGPGRRGAAVDRDPRHVRRPGVHGVPRWLAGAAELGWSPAATHDWNAYKVRLAAQGPRWDALGIRYYRSPQVPWPAR